MRHNRSHDDFFTIDSRDISWNVDAYSQSTNMPNPYFDYDDDDPPDSRREEAEVVSESSSFPSANVWYYAYAYWSHSFVRNGSWTWDGDSGSIGFWESLSRTSCPFFCDKYDTAVCCAQVTPTRSYTSWSPSSGLAPAEDSGTPEADPATLDVEPPPEGRRYKVASSGDRGEIYLRADLTGGVHAYAREARDLASRVAAEGPAHGVLTFRHPIGEDVLDRLEDLGLVITEIEGVSAHDGAGDRWSISVRGDGSGLTFAYEEMASLGHPMLGVISAAVTVPDAGVLASANAVDDVYLLDLSISDYERHVGGRSDIGQNDVYWALAGWQ